MTKKLLSLLTVVAALFVATSCDKNELSGNDMEGNSLVSFTLEQEGIATRSFSDGKTATTLTYAVYAAGDKKPLIVSKDEITFTNKTANVNIQLVNGKEYDILFWVDAQNAPYTFNENDQTITVNYTNVASNDESRDAFYAAKKAFSTNGPITETVKLYRPFAQLNIGSTDYAYASEKAGFTATKSSVKVKTYNTLNLYDGSVDGGAEVEFALANMPGADETFPQAGVKYMAMNYILVDSKELVEVAFTAATESNETVNRVYTNIPVQRNFRTNIYGNILTDPANFNIVIENEYEKPNNDVITSEPANFLNDLANINSSDATNVTIILSGDVEINTYDQKVNSYLLTRKGVNLTIDAAGHTITAIGEGVSSICASENGSLTIKNATIVDKSESYNESSWEMGYLEFGGKLLLENCDIVNAILFAGTELVVDDCNFNSYNDDQYALWIYNGTSQIKDSYFTGARGIKICDMYEGVDVTNVVVDNCTFEELTKKPGVAIDEKQGATMNVTIKNSTFTNTQAGDQGNYIYETDNVVPTLENNTVNIVTVIADGVKYNVTSQAYEISNDNGMMWLANEANSNQNNFEGQTINIVEDIQLTENWTPICDLDNRFKGTIDGQGHTITGLKINVADNAGLIGALHKVGVIKNLTIVDPEVTNTGKALAAAFVAYAFGDVINCHVVGGTISSTNHNNATGAGGICGAAYQSVMGCTAKNVTLISKGRNMGGIVASYSAFDNKYHPKFAITACYAENVNMNSSYNVTGDLPYYGGITSGCAGFIVGCYSIGCTKGENKDALEGRENIADRIDGMPFGMNDYYDVLVNDCYGQYTGIQQDYDGYWNYYDQYGNFEGAVLYPTTEFTSWEEARAYMNAAITARNAEKPEEFFCNWQWSATEGKLEMIR